MHKILIVEQDRALNNGIALALKAESYLFLQAFGLKEADELLKKQKVELVILDLNLPDGDEVEFLKNIKETYHIPVVILTGRDMEKDAAAGLESGADDYITKPFSLMVLVSKVHAVMRRADRGPKTSLCSGELKVSYAEMKAYRGEEQLSLSKKELQLLIYMMENARQILCKEQILEHVWDVDGQFVDENTVPVNISRLKAKIGDGYIQNVRGIGYIWTEESFRE